jgi:hypothetical protein
MLLRRRHSSFGTEVGQTVKLYVQMPYDELSRLAEDNEDDHADREMARRYLLFRSTMRDLDGDEEFENTGYLACDIIDETSQDIAKSADVAVERILRIIRELEMAQLEHFGAGAHHVTAFARHYESSTASEVPFKLLFGLPVTTGHREYNDVSYFGDDDTEDFWNGPA